MADLTRRTMRSVSWTSIGKALDLVSRIVVLGVLARLIPDEEHGIMAGALAVFLVAQVVAEWGIGEAIIQRRELTDTHLRTAFGLSLAFSFSVFAVLFLTAPLFESALNIEGLSDVLRVLALALPIRHLSLGEYLAQRGLRFKRWAMVELAGYLIGYGVVSVSLAVFFDAGVWAFVFGQLGNYTFKTVCYWFVERHPMVPVYDREAAGDILGYGSGQFLGRLANVAAGQLPFVVVSRGLSTVGLAQFRQSSRVAEMPAGMLGQVISQVMFPAMAEIQNETARLRAAMLTAVQSILLIATPPAVLGAILAPELVDVLLGDQWDPAAVPLGILSVAIMFRAGVMLLDALTRATGNVYRRATRQAAYLVVAIASAAIGLYWGLAGVAVGIVFSHVFIFFLMSDLALKVTSTGWGEYLKVFRPAAVSAAVMTAACLPPVLVMRPFHDHIAQIESRALPELTIGFITTMIAAVAVALACRFPVGPLVHVKNGYRDFIAVLPAKVKAPTERILLGAGAP